MKYLLLIFLGINYLFADDKLQVIKPVFNNILQLKIIRAEVDSFETYSLMNFNGREMTLVCANNVVYKNPHAFIIYRNFYGEIVNKFIIFKNSVCRDMAKFIESSSFGIDEDRPFFITLSKNDLKVRKIVYPKLDPYADHGLEADLLPKKRVLVRTNKSKVDVTMKDRP